MAVGTDSSVDAEDAALATLVRMYEAVDATDATQEQPTQLLQMQRDTERLAKAYTIVATVAHDEDRFKAVLAKKLQSETSVGRSAYSTELSFQAVVQAVFWGLSTPQDAREGEKLRAMVFAQVLSLVHSANASSVAQRVAVLLLQQLHKLRVTDLAIAVNEVLRGVTHAQRSQHRGVDSMAVFYTIELLPQLLLRVSASMTLSFEVSQSDNGVGDLSGPEYRQRVLTKLTAFVWPRRFFLQVLKSFRDITLTQDEERLFCIKIYREARKELNSASDQVRTLEIFPTVCLHVLQLVGRTENVLCTRLLARLLINKSQQLTTVSGERNGGTAFQAAGAGELSDRELRGLQSNVLYHVDTAMRQWERLGKTILVEYEQRSPQKLSTFDIALLLLVASHKKHEQPVMQHLLRYAVDTYNTQRMRATNGGDEALNRKAFISVVQHAQDGNWTAIVQQMIALAFMLIEFRGLKSDHASGSGGEASTSQTKPAGWVDFGIRLLLACFQYHAPQREKVQDHIVNMIIVQNADCRTYIYLVSRIVRRHIAELGGSLEARIRECLEYVTHLHPDYANSLLVALSPLLKTQHGLKGFVIMMLRKAMFRKDEGSRIIGIQGFALLLCLSSRIFSRNRTLSQLYSQNVTMLSQGYGAGNGSSMHHHSSALETDLASQEQSHALAAEDMYRQFCGVFRRGFDLQTRVRLVLYAELIKVFTECPALQQSILGLIFQHYQRYYEFNETVQPPLKLDLSVSRKRGVYEEPLAHLLHAMLHCFLEMKKESVETQEEDEETMMDDIPATQAGGSNQLMETMEQNISVLFERLKRCELSDFDFDKNSSFSNDTELGETNRRIARLVMGMMQVAMNWFVSRRQAEADCSGSEIPLMPEETWNALLQYAQIHAWIERRLLDSDGSQKQQQPMKKIKLTKGPTKTGVKKPGRPSADAVAAAEEHALDSAFENSAQLQWATLLSPDTLLQILEFAAKKAKGSEGQPSLSADEEAFVIMIAEKSTHVLDLVQLKLTDEKFEDGKQQKFRHSPDAISRFNHAKFTRRLGDIFLKLLRCYCNEEVSLTVPTGTSTRRRCTEEDNQSREKERMRCLVRICVQGFARIVDMWSLQPLEEFEEQLIRALCVATSVDEDSPDYDVGGDEADGIVRALPPLQKLTEELLTQEMPDEAHRLLDVVQIVWSRSDQPSASPSSTSVSHAAILKQSTTWVKDQLISHSNQASAKLLEKLVILLLRPHDSSAFQSDLAEQLAKGLRHFCKNRGEDADDDVEEVPADGILFQRLSDKSVLTVANAILSKIDEALVETEYSIKSYDKDQKRHAVKFKEDDFTALQKLEEETGSQVFSSGEGVFGGVNSAVMFKRLCKELHDLAAALTPFVAMNLDSPPASIRTVRLVTRLYKLLVLGMKDKLRRKDATLPKFLRQLFDRTATILSKELLEFVAFIHENTTRTDTGKKRASKANSAGTKNLTAKFIPDVIFQLEQFDVVMIKLSKLCKANDFSGWCKLRPVRDFRLNKEQVQKSLHDNIVKKNAEAEEQDTTQTMGGSDDETVTEVPSTASGNDDTESGGDEEPEVVDAPAPQRGKKRRANAIEAAESDAEDAEDVEEEDEGEEIEELEEAEEEDEDDE